LIIVILLVNFAVERIRNVIVYKRYLYDFVNSLSSKTKNKVIQILYLLTVAEKIPAKFFKHIEGTDGLYEIRVEYSSNIYRIFCCFDEGKIIVLFNGFQKKSQKIPHNEIDKALKIKELYFKGKKYGEETQPLDFI